MDFFVARLMSLNEHELRCLRSDHELQSHLQRTHLLMESKLQQYSNASSSSSSTSSTSSSSSSSGALMLAAAAAAAADNYAALDLRLSDQQPTHGQQSQLHQIHQLQLQLHHQHQLQQQQQQQHQQHQHHLQQHRLQQQQQQHHHYQQQQQQQLQQQQLQLQQQQEKCFNYKKMKFIEWTSNGSTDESSPTPSLSTASTTLARDDLANSPPITSNNHTPLSTPTPNTTTTATPTATPNHNHTHNHNHNHNHLCSSPAGALTLVPAATPTITATGGGKKYKGEFDEPNALEVELRLKLLMHDDNYHSKMSPRGECACILGSEFRDKTASSVLAMVEQWRLMPTDQRVTFKWDMNDLPKDIPLSDIKRFENLRREASSGRADFGGASKRKPLGIRGTRQFLLILYCLWGHPGRDDPMQREGYCPHCFAKIKKPNEQSTLVRVVNHFNMKHRRGANPRT